MTVGAGSITGNSGGGGGGGTSSMEGSSIVGSIGNVGSNGVGENVGMPRKSSSHTQLAMMDGNMFSPVSDFSGTAPGTAPRTAPKKALNGPILFERTREADGEPSPSVLRGRVLRPGVSPTPNEGNVSVSKVCCAVHATLRVTVAALIAILPAPLCFRLLLSCGD